MEIVLKLKTLVRASTGIAACLLGGNTCHTAFGLPHNRHCTSAIKKESRRGTPLIEAAIVIVDEAMNIANIAISCMNTTLQDFKNRPQELFGNTVVFIWKSKATLTRCSPFRTSCHY